MLSSTSLRLHKVPVVLSAVTFSANVPDLESNNIHTIVCKIVLLAVALNAPTQEHV